MPSIKSRVNGLIVAIPPDAGRVVNRFATQGGNELIFEQQRNQRFRGDDEPVRVGGKAAKQRKQQDSELA